MLDSCSNTNYIEEETAKKMKCITKIEAKNDPDGTIPASLTLSERDTLPPEIHEKRAHYTHKLFIVEGRILSVEINSNLLYI